MTKKKEHHEILGKIPRKLTVMGVIICLLAIASILYAAYILFY